MSPGLSSAVVGGLIGKGVVMGIVHVLTGPDHMSALATITAGRKWHKSFFAGIQWGIGHSAGLVVIAAIFFSLKGTLDLNKIGTYTDWIVGVLMMALGLFSMYMAVKVEKRRQSDKEVEAEMVNGELTAMAKDGELRPAVGADEAKRADVEAGRSVNGEANGISTNGNDHVNGQKLKKKKDCGTLFRDRVLAFLIGLVHGVAGPGGILGVLPAVQMASWQASTIYLATFCIFSDLTMGIFAALYGGLTRRAGKNNLRLTFYLKLFSAFLSFFVGVLWIILSSMGILDKVFD